MAVGIHLDDEGPDSGSVRVIPRSHQWGILSHTQGERFASRCTDSRRKLDDEESVLMTGPAGFVTAHHCLTLHMSAPKRNAQPRRVIIFQYRAQDNI